MPTTKEITGFAIMSKRSPAATQRKSHILFEAMKQAARLNIAKDIDVLEDAFERFSVQTCQVFWKHKMPGLLNADMFHYQMDSIALQVWCEYSNP